MNSTALWDQVDQLLELEQPPSSPLKVPMARRRRRAFDEAEFDARSTLQLVRDGEGILRWVYQPPARARSGRRVYRSMHVDPGAVVQRFRFHDLGANDITTGLQALDARLTPGPGLKRWQAGSLQPVVQPKIAGEVLLLVHGTFSQSAMFFDELQATAAGQALLADWENKYQAILAFNHPTLSVGAWSNAVDLMHALARVSGPLDLVCHSRGGLVASWLMRLAPLPVRSVVFVGSPLVGTSLASPAKLRAALDMMANFAEAVADVGGLAGPAIPLAAGAAGLARIFGKTLRLGSSLPIVDAAVSLVPGLATQQKTSNNLEIRQLFSQAWQVTPPKLAGIGGHFQPDESAQGWKFWKRFSHVGDQLKYSAAELVFQGENDLVVDVESMSALGEGGLLKPFKHLGASPTTHHTNYFRDARVLKFLAAQL